MAPGVCERGFRHPFVYRRGFAMGIKGAGFGPVWPGLDVVAAAGQTRPAPRRSMGLIVALALVCGIFGLASLSGADAAQNDDANAAIARQFFDEVHGRGDLALAEQIVAEDAVFHIPGAELVGPAGVGGLVTLLRTAFPDAEFPIEDMVVADDTVAVRWTMSGTSEGDFLGNAPTGERVTMSGIAILRIVDGRIVEDWVEYDIHGLLTQLGAIPGPDAAAEADAGARPRPARTGPQRLEP